MSAKTSSQAKKQENKALFTCFGDVNGECQKLLQIRTRILWAILLIVNINLTFQKPDTRSFSYRLIIT